MAMGLIAGLPLLLLSILAASMIFTWLYNSTRGSLLMVILFHALFDFLSVSRAGGDNVAAIMSAGVMIWAVASCDPVQAGKPLAGGKRDGLNRVPGPP